MSFENILFSIDAGIARITLNRPDRLNSFTVAMHRELREAISTVKADPSARVLLLTGAGRGFCAGQDLSDRAVAPGGAAVDLGDTVRSWWAPLVMSLRTLPMPVVVAVNGVAAGAGANVALAGDIVVATRSASFIQPFCKLGLIPDTGGTWALPRLLGTARAMRHAGAGLGTDLEDGRRRGVHGRDRGAAGAAVDGADVRAGQDQGADPRQRRADAGSGART